MGRQLIMFGFLTTKVLKIQLFEATLCIIIIASVILNESYNSVTQKPVADTVATLLHQDKCTL